MDKIELADFIFTNKLTKKELESLNLSEFTEIEKKLFELYVELNNELEDISAVNILCRMGKEGLLAYIELENKIDLYKLKTKQKL